MEDKQQLLEEFTKALKEDPEAREVVAGFLVDAIFQWAGARARIAKTLKKWDDRLKENMPDEKLDDQADESKGRSRRPKPSGTPEVGRPKIRTD